MCEMPWRPLANSLDELSIPSVFSEPYDSAEVNGHWLYPSVDGMGPEFQYSSLVHSKVETDLGVLQRDRECQRVGH